MVRLTLDTVLKEKNVSRYQLSKMMDVQYHIIDKYYKNKVVRYDSYILDRICAAIDCDISDIIEYSKEEQEKGTAE